MIRKQLAEETGEDMAPRKAFVKEQVVAIAVWLRLIQLHVHEAGSAIPDAASHLLLAFSTPTGGLHTLLRLTRAQHFLTGAEVPGQCARAAQARE